MKKHVVIISGGSGARLWPSSRLSLPKQFIKIQGGKTLFGQTLERVHPENIDKLTVVSSKQHNFLCNAEVAKLGLNASFILEEIGRNTAPAILMAALGASPSDTMIIMPSDHWIEDKNLFNELLDRTIKVISGKSSWATFGITPTEPSTGYGYICCKGEKEFSEVLHFKEKPDLQIAKTYLKEKNYFWNSGIFVVDATTCIESFKKHQPNLYETALIAWNHREERNKEVILMKQYLEKISSISVDYAILEKEKKVLMAPFRGNWSDVGNWDGFSKILEREGNSYNKHDNTLQIDCDNTTIHSDGRTIAAIGISNTIIVNNDDATLIVKKGHTEKVKGIVESLIAINEVSGVEHTFEYRPWGMFESLFHNEFCKVKKLTVYPGQHLSLQYHHKRSEHWVIVKGQATVTKGDEKFFLETGQSVDIPLGLKHALGNDSHEELVVIEVQMGSYFGEDDIVRISDPYNR